MPTYCLGNAGDCDGVRLGVNRLDDVAHLELGDRLRLGVEDDRVALGPVRVTLFVLVSIAVTLAEIVTFVTRTPPGSSPGSVRASASVRWPRARRRASCRGRG